MGSCLTGFRKHCHVEYVSRYAYPDFPVKQPSQEPHYHQMFVQPTDEIPGCMLQCGRRQEVAAHTLDIFMVNFWPYNFNSYMSRRMVRNVRSRKALFLPDSIASTFPSRIFFVQNKCRMYHKNLSVP